MKRNALTITVIIAFLIGLALCAGGAALCASIIGLTAGIPMVIFGGGLMIRSIF